MPTRALETRRDIMLESHQMARAFRADMPDWRQLLEGDLWQEARQRAVGGPRVIIAATTAGDAVTSPLETALGVALTLRGADVRFLLCDQTLPACSLAHGWHFEDPEEFVRDGPSRRNCPSCWRPARQAFEQLSLPLIPLSSLLGEDERRLAREVSQSVALEEVPDFVYAGVAAGEHAMSGVLKFFARGELAAARWAEPTLRRFLHAALLTQAAVTRAIEVHQPGVFLFNHGVYVPLGVIGDVCRRDKVRVVTWIPAYRSQTCIFSHDDTYHKTLLTEPVSAWTERPWTEQHESEIQMYLQSRWKASSFDWLRYNESPQEDVQAIAAEVGIDFTKTTIGLLTNVVWDAQGCYPANAFANMIEWVLETIRYFRDRPELQLLIRVHPAEVDPSVIRSNQPIIAEIDKVFRQLPENVFIIPPESRVSTYVAMSRCNAVLIYATKTGVEMAARGIPVIAAGEAWIRNKGITRDATSAEHYRQLLDELPASPMPPEQVQRALQYAFHFFFRRMIPMQLWQAQAGPVKVRVASVDQLQAGQDRGLDLVCAGILEGTPFVYEADNYLTQWRGPDVNAMAVASSGMI